MEMDNIALKIVFNYINKRLEELDSKTSFDLFIVWKAKVLQNWKYLISSTLIHGAYYELTYNGDKHEWYLDVYMKFENRVISGRNPEIQNISNRKSGD